MSLDNVTAGKNTPHEFNVIIEIPMNADPIKYEVDKETGAIFVDRFMSTSMHYPTNYGYVPKTISGDGDPVDVLVITPVPLIPGVVVTCRPIGILKMEDEAGQDGKVLAVPTDKILSIYTQWQKPEDMNPMRLKTIAHFLNTTKTSSKASGSRFWAGKVLNLPWKKSHKALRTTRSNTADSGLLFKGKAFVQLLKVVVDTFAFSGQKIRHRFGKTWVREPMRTVRADRQQGARHFVFTLRAAFKADKAIGDAPVNRLVVASLKVQTVNTLQSAPIAAIGDITLNGDQAAGHSLAIFVGNEQHPVLGHRVLHALKKITAQIRCVTVFKIGLRVARVEKVPVLRLNLWATQGFEGHASFMHFPPFLPNLLSLFLIQAGQEMIKVFVLSVVPMKLNGMPLEPARRLSGLQVVA